MITTILTAYNRPNYLESQINSIKNQTVKSDIWIWYNKGDKDQKVIPEIKASYCSYNFGFFSRFAFALLAETEYIAIFDDDTIPGNKWFENCIDTIKKCNGVLGTVGIRLNGDTYNSHKCYGWKGNNNKEIEEVDLVGHGWFFKREWLKYMWYEKPFTFKNGEDIHFSYSCQKFGGIYTFVPPHPPGCSELWGSLNGSSWGADEEASYRKNAITHGLLRDEIVKHCLNNGWNPLFARKQ